MFSLLSRDRSLPTLPRTAVYIGALALVLRLSVFFFILVRFGDAGFILPPFSDGHGYVTIATNMLDGNGFSRAEAPPFIPDTKRVPLYPLFLASVFALSGGAWWLAALLQTILGAFLAALTYTVTRSVADERAGLFAGVVAAIFPFDIFLSTQLLTETLFTFALFSAFALFIRSVGSAAYRTVALAGALIGIATLIKPAGQYVPFLLVPFLVWGTVGRRRFTVPLVYIVCFFLIISPWIIRNKYERGVATLSYEANILFDLHLAGYRAYTETGSAARAAEYRSAGSEEALLAVSRGELVRKLLGAAVGDPIGFATYLSLTTVPFVLGDGFVTMVVALSSDPTIPAWDFSTSPSALGRTVGFGVLPVPLLMLSITSKLLWVLILCGALIGFVRLIADGSSRRIVAVSILVVISYFMVAGGPVQSARYRTPVEPLIFMLTGIGAAEAFRRFNGLRSHR